MTSEDADRQKPPMALSEDRIRHIAAVAERAARIGGLVGIRDEETIRRLFALGWLHDIGYALASSGERHEEVGGRFLRSVGYADWREVAEHGNPDTDCSSPLLDVLNAADMLTNSRGEAVTFQERLADIAERYGADSPVTERARRVVATLMRRGYGIAEEDVLREREALPGDPS